MSDVDNLRVLTSFPKKKTNFTFQYATLNLKILSEES